MTIGSKLSETMKADIIMFRRWKRLHLSTAVFLTIVVLGAMIWPDFIPEAKTIAWVAAVAGIFCTFLHFAQIYLLYRAMQRNDIITVAMPSDLIGFMPLNLSFLWCLVSFFLWIFLILGVYDESIRELLGMGGIITLVSSFCLIYDIWGSDVI